MKLLMSHEAAPSVIAHLCNMCSPAVSPSALQYGLWFWTLSNLTSFDLLASIPIILYYIVLHRVILHFDIFFSKFVYPQIIVAVLFLGPSPFPFSLSQGGGLWVPSPH